MQTILQPIDRRSNPAMQFEPDIFNYEPSRHDYTIAAWCYVNAFLSLKNAHTREDAANALRELNFYFGKKRNMEGLYRKICEKATLLAVYQQVMNIRHHDLWQTLLSRKA